jgi:hypothetical protein
MSFLDRAVESYFRDAQGGRVVVARYQGRTRGYKVESAGDEARIRAFLKLLLFAQLSIQVLGACTAFSAVNFTRQWNAAERWHDLALLLVTFLAAYAVFAALPVLLLWRLYKQALPSLVSLRDEVQVSPLPGTRAALATASAVLLGLALLLILFLRFYTHQR